MVYLFTYLFIYLFIYFIFSTAAPDNFGIVEPFPPDNIYPIEFSSAEVTCVAFDPSGVKVPREIQFIKNYLSSIETHIMPTANLYFTSRTEKQGIYLRCVPGISEGALVVAL